MSFTLPKRNFTRNKWRTFLIILGIAISVGIETGIAISVDSLFSDFILHHRGNNLTDITIHPANRSTMLEMRTVENEVKKIEGVEKVALVGIFTLIDLPSFIEDRPELENITNSKVGDSLYRYVKRYRKNKDNDYKLEETCSLVDFLKKRNYHIVNIKDVHQKEYMINFLNLGTAIGIATVHKEFERVLSDDLRKNGIDGGDIKIHYFDYSDVHAMYGALHCTTQVSRY